MRNKIIKFKTISLLIFILGIISIPIYNSYQNKRTYYESLDIKKDIFPIISKNCTPCHHNEGIAPITLLNTEDFYKNAPMIQEVLSKRIMPQWMPDPSFSEFRNQRVLEEEERKTIINFIKYNKSYFLNIHKEDTISIYKEKNNTSFDTSITISMAKSYPINGNNKDKFINFYLPSNITQDFWLRGINLISENKKLVHHAWLFQSKVNKLTESEKNKLSYGFDINYDEWSKWDILYGYLPGFTQSFYEKSLSKKIKKNTEFFLQIHYYATPFPQKDSTYITLFLDKKKPKYELNYLIISEDYLNKELFIPKNSKRKFNGTYTIEENMVLYSIIPHMHFRGKKIFVQAILPTKKKINLIKIEDWNFNNQELYIFKDRIKLPKGSIVKFWAEFDNTVKNSNNPIIPPIDVRMGDSSKDEMLQIIFEYYKY